MIGLLRAWVGPHIVELLGDDATAQLVVRLNGGGDSYRLPLGNAHQLHEQLGHFLAFCESCRRCSHPRREHFDWSVGDGTRVAGCTHDAPHTGGYFDIRALPCQCEGIDR